MAIQPTLRRCRGASSRRKTRSSLVAKKSPSHKPAKQPDSFRSFAKLPTELRLKIWELSLPSPRLVSIRCGSDDISSPEPTASTPNLTSPRNDMTTGCISSAEIPANLHVCEESRLEALQTYRPSFGFARGPGQLLFNPEVDIMYFGPHKSKSYMAAMAQFLTSMGMCNPDELASVRRLAINDALFWSSNKYNSMTAASLTLKVLEEVATRMTDLEELIFVPWEEEEGVLEEVVQGRMTRQIQTAMQSIAQQYPYWESPSWKIVPLSDLPSTRG